MHYWDTSALLKLYVSEADSAFFLELISRTHEPVATSAIANAEVLCALSRKESVGDLKLGGASTVFRRFRADCLAGRILLIPYGLDLLPVMERLARLAFERRPPILVRSLDLIHLATAVAGKATTLVATDQRLRELAPLLPMDVLP